MRTVQIRWAKVALFALCLEPSADLLWRFFAQRLGANPIEYVTHATGDWALRLLLITLAVTPLRKLPGLTPLIRFRRMLGLFAFFYGCLHFLTYLWLDKFLDTSEILGDIAKRPFITIGFIAVVLMAPLAITSTDGWVRRLGGLRWQRLHRLVYIVGFAAVVHYYWLVKSDIRLPVFYATVLGILLVARIVAPRTGNRPKPVRLRLSGVRPETDDSVTLRFALLGRKRMEAKPGQFLTFDWVVDGKRVPRSYSISSSPRDGKHVEITVKRQGYVSSYLNRSARRGMTVTAHGPYGQFYFDEKRDRSVTMIAAGSGITPCISMLRYIADSAPSTQVELLYGVRSERDIIFERDLHDLQARIPQFNYTIIASRAGNAWRGPRGHIDREHIERRMSQLADQTFFVCGPVGFMSDVTEALSSLGVPAERVLRERFTVVSASVSPGAEYAVDFARSGKKGQGTSAETLLAIAEKNGIAIQASCRVGQCGTCATRILEGEVDMEVTDGLDPALRAQGYRLLCVGYGRNHTVLDA
jgi:sulfoxide reductase heme-binding subunit YedZ